MNVVFDLRVPADARLAIAARLIAAVMRVTGLDLERLRAQDRRAHVSAVCTAMAWLLLEVAQLPATWTGSLLERDRTTVMHAHRVALRHRARDVILAVLDDEME